MADIDHNKLPPILAWDNNDNGKEKQREELTWEATINAWTDNNQKEKNKEKGKERKENIPEEITTTKEITSGWEKKYSHESIKELPYISLKCKDYGKKLSSMGAWVAPDEDYWMQTHYYCKPYHREQYGYPKRQGKWDNESCLACGKQLLNEGMCNDIPGQGKTCNALCQYMILISDWVSRAIFRLDSYPHDEDEICTSPSEILEIKNNPPEPTDIVLVLNLDAFIDLENSSEEFHEHYQNLAPTREKQEQCLEEINT
ncbi:hypothetical protein G9A89_019310 [Geosiphon pyriformis]|nr:hypothetical protein G9A89_019310 [Geosiphon pyriformis]